MLTNAVVRSLGARGDPHAREQRYALRRDHAAAFVTLHFHPPRLLENEVFRGDGLFLGWPQEELAATYQALLKKDDEAPLELIQLG